MKKAKANSWGDLVCPHCKSNLITPKGYRVQEGRDRCSRCQKRFDVSEDVAKDANLRRRLSTKALIDKVIAEGIVALNRGGGIIL